MPDDNRVRFTYNGRIYSASPEDLQELTKRGIKYEVAPPLEAAAQPAADAPPERETDALDIAGGVARGALHGATLGLSDVPIGGKSIPERLGFDPYEKVQEEMPIASAVGDVAGGFALPGGALLKLAGKLGVAPKALNALLAGKGVIAKIGAGAAEAAGEGALRAATEGSDIGDAATISAIVGGGGSALAHGVGSAAKAAQGALQRGSDATLARSVGVLSKEAGGLGEVMGGPDLVPAEIAKIVREVSPSTIRNPKSATDRYRELDAALSSKYGPLVDDLVRQASIPDEAIKPAYQRVVSQLMGEVAGAPSDTASARAYRDALKRNASEMAKNAVPADAVGLRELKTAYNKDAYTPYGAPISDKGKGLAAGTQAQATDDALDDLMQQHASPEVRQAFHENNADYAKRAKVRDLAEQRAKVEATDTLLPEIANAAAGAAFGALTSEDSLMGGIAGGVAGGVAGATRSGFLKSQQSTKGLDRLSNIAAAGSKGAGAVSSAIENMGRFAGAGRRALVSTLLRPEDEEYAP